MRIAIIVFALSFLSASVIPAEAYWIWTPKTGKWVNPKSAVKPTPKEQFDTAKGLYDIKSYEEAKREFKKLLKVYPKSAEAAGRPVLPWPCRRGAGESLRGIPGLSKGDR